MTAGQDSFIQSIFLESTELANPSFLWAPASFDGSSVRKHFSDPGVDFSPK